MPADYLAEANRRTLVFAMIETQEALDNLDAIAATPGLDGLFVGPNDLVDLARASGWQCRSHDPEARCSSAARSIAAAAKNKLVAGRLRRHRRRQLPLFRRHGFKFIVAATDVGLLAAGAKAMQDQLEQI